jgi:hypothetical protein
MQASAEGPPVTVLASRVCHLTRVAGRLSCSASPARDRVGFRLLTNETTGSRHSSPVSAWASAAQRTADGA